MNGLTGHFRRLTADAEAGGTYREKVAALQVALKGEDAMAAREQLQALIDEV